MIECGILTNLVEPDADELFLSLDHLQMTDRTRVTFEQTNEFADFPRVWIPQSNPAVKAARHDHIQAVAVVEGVDAAGEFVVSVKSTTRHFNEIADEERSCRFVTTRHPHSPTGDEPHLKEATAV